MDSSRPPRGPSGPKGPGNFSDNNRGPSSSGPSSSGPRPFNSSSPRPAGSGYQGTNPRPPGTGYQGTNPRPPGSGYQGSNPRPAGAGGGFGGPRPPYGGPRPAGGGFGGPRPSYAPRFVKEKSKDDLRINAEITVPNVRLVDENGEMAGVVDTKTAITRAEEAGLDLVEISPQADPPVCKILDYGKYRYEQEKKAAEARKKQKIVELKEIKVRPTIGDHDYEIKMKQARKFLEEGDKVKFSLRFKGREQSHAELGFAVFTRIKEDLKDIMKVEQEPKFEGRQVIMVSIPSK